MAQIGREASLPVQVQRAGTMFTLFFARGELRDWPSVKACDTTLFARFFRAMLEQGIYLPPSQFEAGFLSAAHDEGSIECTLEAARFALNQ